jgi:twitching motility two-component system response regulator PilG
MKVLIVDDTKTLLSVIQIYLMGWGLEFVEAYDGAEGLRKARQSNPDLVISDVRMPEMNGFELCAALRADPALRATPVVLLTALSDAASREQGLLVGATAFLTKPVTVEGLRSVVRKALKLPQGK